MTGARRRRRGGDGEDKGGAARSAAAAGAAGSISASIRSASAIAAAPVVAATAAPPVSSEAGAGGASAIMEEEVAAVASAERAPPREGGGERGRAPVIGAGRRPRRGAQRERADRVARGLVVELGVHARHPDARGARSAVAARPSLGGATRARRALERADADVGDARHAASACAASGGSSACGGWA